MHPLRRQFGFTLTEALVSCLILAAGAIVVCQLAQRCVESSHRGAFYEQGYRLVDECLDRAAADGMDKLSRWNRIEGDFGDRYPGYRYELEINPTDTVDLYHVAARVTWERAGQQYTVVGRTLMFENMAVE